MNHEPTRDQALGIDEPTRDQALGIDEPTRDKALGLDEPTRDKALGIDEPTRDQALGPSTPVRLTQLEETDIFQPFSPAGSFVLKGPSHEIDVGCNAFIMLYIHTDRSFLIGTYLSSHDYIYKYPR